VTRITTALERRALWPVGIPLPARLRSGVVWGRLLRRAATISALAILTAYAAISVAAVLANWHFYDAEGYWQAGMRLRDGQLLYPALASQDAPEVFRYAPWFAWTWWGLSYLTHDAVMAGWLLILASAAVYTLWLLPRSLGGALVTLVLAPMLFRAVSQGNVQPLLIALLAFGLTRRSGPIWIGVAASLKFVPLLLASVYAANREYRRAAIAVAVTVVLWLPALAYGLEHYPTTVGGESFPFGWSTYVIVGIALLVVFVGPARYRLLAACVAAAFASPRWIPYNPTYIAPAAMRARKRLRAPDGPPG
jgi:hypothetical protein